MLQLTCWCHCCCDVKVASHSTPPSFQEPPASHVPAGGELGPFLFVLAFCFRLFWIRCMLVAPLPCLNWCRDGVFLLHDHPVAKGRQPGDLSHDWLVPCCGVLHCAPGMIVGDGDGRVRPPRSCKTMCCVVVAACCGLFLGLDCCGWVPPCRAVCFLLAWVVHLSICLQVFGFI
jgi:hypothetical protein